MERRIPLSRGFLVALLAVVVNLCYHLGVIPTLKLCVSGVLYLLYAIFFTVATLSLVVGVSMAVACFVMEVLEADDSRSRHRPIGGLVWESCVISVFATIIGFFVGNTYAVLFSYAGEVSFLSNTLGVSFSSAEIFRIENLLPLFWKPYLGAYVVSLFLALFLWCDRKHCAIKRKKGKRNKVVRW